MKICFILLLVGAAFAVDWHAGPKLVQKSFRGMAELPKKSAKFMSGVSHKVLDSVKASGRRFKGGMRAIEGLTELPKKSFRFWSGLSHKAVNTVKSSGKRLLGGMRAIQDKTLQEDSSSESPIKYVNPYIVNPLPDSAKRVWHTIPHGLPDLYKNKIREYQNADGHYVFQNPGESSYNPSFAPSQQAVRRL